MLIITFTVAILAALGIFIVIMSDEYGVLNFIGISMAFVGILCTIIAPIIWIAEYADSKSNIYQYEAIKVTIEQSRSKEIDPLERAALTQKIIDLNATLASAKYYNQTFVGDMISDDFANLPYLK